MRYAAKSRPLDLEKMRRAAAYFVGEKDFASFCAADSAVKSTVRTIYSAEVEAEGELVFFTVCGSGFLYNMVRIMAGLLAEAGEGKIPPERVKGILEEKKRCEGKTAPAAGLCLLGVEYD